MQFGTTDATRVRPLGGAYPRLLARSRHATARLVDVPLPVALLLLAVFVPGELDFVIGTLRLNCQRLVLIIWGPIAVIRLLQGRRIALRGFDLLLMGAFLYYAFSILVKEPLDKSIAAAGILLLESIGSYLIARVYIRNEIQFLASVKLLFWMVLLMGILAIPEAVSFNRWFRNMAAALSGARMWPPDESRLGLMRAMVVFDHPIHYGVFCASVFALVWFVEWQVIKRVIRAALVAAAAFFSLSSAPLLGIGLVLAGTVWESITRRIPNRVWLTIILVGSLYSLLALMTNRSPFRVFVTSFVFDPGNAWYRMLIWDYGVDNVINNPWIGVPLGTWDRPAWMPNDTIDNYWLVVALWGGLPSAILQGLGIIALLRRATRRRPLPEDPVHRHCRYAWSAAVLMLCLVGATVSYWGALGIHFMFCVGLGAWLADNRSGRATLPLGPMVLPTEADKVFGEAATVETMKQPR
jgi:hypothetical protein